MAKKILIPLSIYICFVLLIISAWTATLYLGLPDKNAQFWGKDYIDVPDDPDLTIRVMTYNIRSINKEKEEEHNWDNRREHVANLINRNAPDIIGLQEVTHIQFKYLIEQLGDNYAYAGISRSGIGLKRGDYFLSSIDAPINAYMLFMSNIISEATVIFYKKSRFEVLDYSTIWLSETPEKPSRGWDSGCKRIVNRLNLLDHYTGEKLVIFNTHFDYSGVIAKEKSVELMLNWAEQADKTIVMGDFNFVEQSANYNRLVSTILSDTKYLAPPELTDEGATFNGFEDIKMTSPIDYIFTNPMHFEVISYKIIRDKNNNFYISDHYPIIADLVQSIEKQF